jgi:hypothetical protein
MVKGLNSGIGDLLFRKGHYFYRGKLFFLVEKQHFQNEIIGGLEGYIFSPHNE